MGRVRTFINGKEIGHMFLAGKEVQVAYIDGKKVYEKPPELLFYAPLTQHKNAVYAWDNKLGILSDSGTVIQNNALYLPNANSGIMFQSTDINKNEHILVISCYINPINYSYGLVNNTMVGILNPSVAAKGYIMQAGSNASSLNLSFFNTANIATLTPPLPNNVNSFVTAKVISKNNSLTGSLYINGILKVTRTINLQNPDIFNGGQHPSIGYSLLRGSVQGYYKQFSIYSGELSDNEIMQLYQNGGVPQGF